MPFEAMYRDTLLEDERAIFVNCRHSYKKFIVYFKYKFVWDDSGGTRIICMAGA
jgi:hypothetical protein